MTQVPASSHGGFNGGTITGALVIDTRPDAATLPLRVRAGDPTTTGFDIRLDPSAPRVYYQGLDSYAQMRFYDDFSSSLLDVANSGVTLTATGGAISRQDADFANLISLRSSGLWLAIHAAPADGDLNDGDCVLWFDQTNGAAKLKAKAKTADGTVVTASVALA